MKTKLIVLIAFITVCVMAVSYDMWANPEFSPYNNMVEKSTLPLPVVTMQNLTNNDRTHINNLNEDIILLNFWASWCTVCIAEMDELFELVADMDGKVALIALSIDETKPAALKAYNAFNARYADAMDNAHIYWGWDNGKEISLKTFNVSKTPETIIINKQRHMVDKIIGAYDWAGHNIREKLHKIK